MSKTLSQKSSIHNLEIRPKPSILKANKHKSTESPTVLQDKLKPTTPKGGKSVTILQGNKRIATKSAEILKDDKRKATESANILQDDKLRTTVLKDDKLKATIPPNKKLKARKAAIISQAEKSSASESESILQPDKLKTTIFEPKKLSATKLVPLLQDDELIATIPQAKKLTATKSAPILQDDDLKATIPQAKKLSATKSAQGYKFKATMYQARKLDETKSAPLLQDGELTASIRQAKKLRATISEPTLQSHKPTATKSTSTLQDSVYTMNEQVGDRCIGVTEIAQDIIERAIEGLMVARDSMSVDLEKLEYCWRRVIGFAFYSKPETADLGFLDQEPEPSPLDGFSRKWERHQVQDFTPPRLSFISIEKEDSVKVPSVKQAPRRAAPKSKKKKGPQSLKGSLAEEVGRMEKDREVLSPMPSFLTSRVSRRKKTAISSEKRMSLDLTDSNRERPSVALIPTQRRLPETELEVHSAVHTDRQRVLRRSHYLLDLRESAAPHKWVESNQFFEIY